MLKSVGIDSNGFKHIRICGHIWHYLRTDSKLWLQIVISGNRFEYVGTNSEGFYLSNVTLKALYIRDNYNKKKTDYKLFQNRGTKPKCSNCLLFKYGNNLPSFWLNFPRPIHATLWDRRGWSDYVKLGFTREIWPDKRTWLKLVCTMTQCRENNTTSKVYRAHPSHPCSLNVHGCALWHAPVL